jgi:hypothetical protein
VHVLCHQSRLKVAKTEVERFRETFGAFLTTEGSILSTWERKYMTQHQGWLRSEATCVIASTLLDISTKELFKPETESDNGREDRDSDVETTTKELLVTSDAERSSLASTDTLSSDPSSQQSFSSPNYDRPPVDWIVFRPPHTYYPKEALASLDDTEEHYKRQSTQKSMQFRRLPTKIHDYLYLESESSEWTKSRLKDALHRNWISVIDIPSNSDRNPRVLGKLRLLEESIPDTKLNQELKDVLSDSVSTKPNHFCRHMC